MPMKLRSKAAPVSNPVWIKLYSLTQRRLPWVRCSANPIPRPISKARAGIEAGGRTGLTSVVVAILFILCLPFASVIGIVPAAATSPALIVVGIMMASSFAKVNWADLTDAIPAFFTVVVMALAYNISYGIAAGFMMFCIVKIFTKKAKEVHPIIYGAAVLFLLNFIFLAIRGL
jgi:AGZA family xanthine/uracil permease-like MFS transporter